MLKGTVCFEVHMHCQHKQKLDLSNTQVVEVFYVCKWALAEDSGAAMLLLTGKIGVLHVSDTPSGDVFCVSTGETLGSLPV